MVYSGKKAMIVQWAFFVLRRWLDVPIAAAATAMATPLDTAAHEANAA